MSEMVHWWVLIGVFALTTHRCGKSIEKRDWGESAAQFLFALGTILLMVKLAIP